ncbi:MAG: hypothetical protein FD157_2116 [Rhodocyclaceae bacterium]|nr:MAG: hypothetical protein FD157_2116 [Rhodocyclaceae bacterium]TND01308.1 MAG: hypothetical protein FD118_2456 [Rhodocyclaceae bacterium]
MSRENTLEQLGPLATQIRELLFLEWEACRPDRTASSSDLYDDYIPAIHRLALDRSSSDDTEGIEHIAAYLNFVVKNYVGRIPDKALNRSVAEKLFTMAEATRQLQSNIP